MMATLLQKWELANGDRISDDFRRRVQMAVVVAARNVHSEDAGTVNHAARVLWAKETLRSPERMGLLFLPAVAVNDTLANQADKATDTDIQTTVDSLINAFAPTVATAVE